MVPQEDHDLQQVKRLLGQNRPQRLLSPLRGRASLRKRLPAFDVSYMRTACWPRSMMMMILRRSSGDVPTRIVCLTVLAFAVLASTIPVSARQDTDRSGRIAVPDRHDRPVHKPHRESRGRLDRHRHRRIAGDRTPGAAIRSSRWRGFRIQGTRPIRATGRRQPTRRWRSAAVWARGSWSAAPTSGSAR